MEFDAIIDDLYKEFRLDKTNNSNNELVNLKEENKKIKELAVKVLNDFDKVNTKLRDTIAERDKLKEENHLLRQECIQSKKNETQRKDLYNEATTLRKERTAYAKAIGIIYGALEELTKSLN